MGSLRSHSEWYSVSSSSSAAAAGAALSPDNTVMPGVHIVVILASKRNRKLVLQQRHRTFHADTRMHATINSSGVSMIRRNARNVGLRNATDV